MRLILLQLNEINFDVVKKYIDSGYKLNNFKKILSENFISTSSENEYQNLEPWIQWVSVYTGMPFTEHKIFRLGDIVNHDYEQIFEKIEKAGFKVGAISPMNAKNNLKNSAYFIPDPWTQTASDKSFISRILSESISQAVNDNSEAKISVKSLAKLLLVFLIVVPLYSKIYLTFFAFTSFFKPWRKSLFLDLFLFEIHQIYFWKKNVNFSSLFLNAGAHIQHHYFFNSKVLKNSKFKNPQWYIKLNEDPIHDMLKTYDHLLGKVLTLKNTDTIIATGLSQEPYDKLKFYYRLKNHANFLDKFNIKFKSIHPRMTRDFLISFENNDQLMDAYFKLSNLKVNNQSLLFKEIEKRDLELFVTLTYPQEILSNTKCCLDELCVNLEDYVVFVAIKNGMHQAKGYAYFSNGIKKRVLNDGDNIYKLNQTILKYFIKS